VGEFADGGYGNDDISAGDGNDSLYGDWGDDWVDGGLGHDKLYGGKGNDVLLGEEGGDTMWGGEGNDLLASGNAGTDVMYGEAGADIFKAEIYSATQIMDFDAAEGDLIDISSFMTFHGNPPLVVWAESVGGRAGLTIGFDSGTVFIAGMNYLDTDVLIMS
jgi:Ca2+-binding RTX toxin-like protein